MDEVLGTDHMWGMILGILTRGWYCLLWIDVAIGSNVPMTNSLWKRSPLKIPCWVAVKCHGVAVTKRPEFFEGDVSMGKISP
jgi:hypothetical protein